MPGMAVSIYVMHEQNTTVPNAGRTTEACLASARDECRTGESVALLFATNGLFQASFSWSALVHQNMILEHPFGCCWIDGVLVGCQLAFSVLLHTRSRRCRRSECLATTINLLLIFP